MDRFDLRVEVPPVAYSDLELPADGEISADICERVTSARAVQTARYSEFTNMRANADMEGEILETFATPDAEGTALLLRVADRFGLSARGYHRILRVARTIADLDGETRILRHHMAEAISFRINC
jgi:magnesium chelatase family protein